MFRIERVSIFSEFPNYRETGTSLRELHHFRGMHPPEYSFGLDMG